MTELYRAQVLLERKQHEALRALAAAEGRSMSEIIREAVAEYLVELDEQRDFLEWEKALDELTKIREEIKARFGVYPGDLIAEIREERADELERVLRGEP